MKSLDGMVLFSEAAAAKIAAMVRREMARYKNVRGPVGENNPFDSEMIIDGVADGDCLKDNVGEMTPSLSPSSSNLKFFNSLGDITDGTRIVIAFSHRSATAAARESGGISTPYILIAAGCD